MTSVDLVALSHTLTGKVLRALDSYEDAKKRYAERTAVWAAKFPDSPATATLAARNDWERSVAISDAQWFRSEIQTYGAAICALDLYRKADPS